MLSWFKHTARGVCMGVADVIPGVSGGTLALILGIYEKFIAAVSAVGPGMVRAVLTREFWRRFVAGLERPGAQGDDEVGTYAGHVLFLGFLVLGIGLAFAVGARFIPTLLDLYPAQMKGFFFGLIIASIVIPYRVMRHRGPVHLLAFVLACVGTYVFVGLPIDQSGNATGTVTVTFAEPTPGPTTLPREGVLFSTARHDGGRDIKREVTFVPTTDFAVPAGTQEIEVPVTAQIAGKVGNVEAGQIARVHNLPGATVAQAGPMAGGVDPALWYIFIAGVIAISAMVLPGLSGSFVLLMFGLYHFMTFNLRAALYQRDPDAMVLVAVFLAALAVGILTFSRFLRWLLQRAPDVTMAVLIGLMVGSLRKIWPFSATTADGEVINTLPTELDARVGITIALVMVGAVLVIGLERIGRARTSEQA